jgi:hypothetical protein
MAKTLTEINFDRLTSRKKADVDARPMTFNPDTSANIAGYTGMVTGDTIFDTTLSQQLTYNGSAWVPIGGQLPNDTWANIQAYDNSSRTLGDTIIDTTFGIKWVWDGTWWWPEEDVAGTALFYKADKGILSFPVDDNDTFVGFGPATSTNGTVTTSPTGHALSTGTTDAEDAAALEVAVSNLVVASDEDLFVMVVRAYSGGCGTGAAGESIFMGVTSDLFTDDIDPETANNGRVGFSISGATETVNASFSDGSAGAVEFSDGDTGLVASSATPKVYVVDAGVPTAVKFLVDGTDYTATALAAATGTPSAVDLTSVTGVGPKNLCPTIRCHKDSGTSLSGITVERVAFVGLNA